MILVCDTETTGKPIDYNAPFSDVDNWPRLVQIAWLRAGQELLPDSLRRVATILPEGFEIPPEATAIHGISTEQARQHGEPIAEVLHDFGNVLLAADVIVGHNLCFDVPVVAAELVRLGRRPWAAELVSKRRYDTMLVGTDVCKIPGHRGYKWPKLEELYMHLFRRRPENQHQADGDVLATAECYFEMVGRGFVPASGGR